MPLQKQNTIITNACVIISIEVFCTVFPSGKFKEIVFLNGNFVCTGLNFKANTASRNTNYNKRT